MTVTAYRPAVALLPHHARTPDLCPRLIRQTESAIADGAAVKSYRSRQTQRAKKSLSVLGLVPVSLGNLGVASVPAVRVAGTTRSAVADKASRTV